MSLQQHNALARFWQHYDALPERIREQADKQFSLLKVNPQHPSLQLKKVSEKHGREWWSVRVTLDYRALAVRQPGGFLWFWIGDHKTYDSLIA
jgi:hypothetical protein